jgi:hypothetical protein
MSDVSMSQRRDLPPPSSSDAPPNWLDVQSLARVHASSEDSQYPIASAFEVTSARGWRAADPGVQVIDVHFRRPRDLTRIRLVFDEDREARTQQFTISWSARRGESHGEVIRQQFNFSPTGAIREVQEYVVQLHGIDALQIHITPDIAGRRVLASLTECRLA